MKPKRRRLASVEAAIVRLGEPVTVTPPPWLTPCTETPACRACWACRVAEHGPDFWVKGIT